MMKVVFQSALYTIVFLALLAASGVGAAEQASAPEQPVLGQRTEISDIPWEGPIPEEDVKVIYGEDDRIDVYEENDPDRLSWAAATCALVFSSQLQPSGDGMYSLSTSQYRVAGLPPCDGERFANQPTAAFCTGFMVKGDLIATAGHCLHPSELPFIRFVFGFDMKNAATPNLSFSADQIYTGVEILARRYAWDYDYAIIRVDREIVAPNAEPLPLRTEGAVAEGSQVGVIGHPAGQPKKIAFGENTVVRENVNPAFFVANLDTYGGNSGSPVFNAATGLVEGILVRGEQDYVIAGNCFRSNVVPDDGGRGEEVCKSTAFASIVYDEYYPPPPNNNCDKAIAVQEDVVMEGSSLGATGMAGATSCGYDNGASVWYVWIPKRDGMARISLCGFADFDTSLAVYPSCLGREIACNDDYCGTASEVTLSVVADAAYYIRIAGNNNTTGNFDLLVSFDLAGEGEGEGELGEGEGESNEGEGEGEHGEGEEGEPDHGSLTVELTPQDAVEAGAQWRREGVSEWRDPGTVETGIAVGVYRVEFRNIIGWETPTPQQVEIRAGEMSTLMAGYRLHETCVGDPIGVWMTNRNARPGTEILIPINVSSAEAVSPAGLQIELTYDPAFLDESSVAVHPTGITGRMSFLPNTDKPGHIIITAMGTIGGVGLRGQGHFFDIYGRVRADVSEGAASTVTLDVVSFYDREARLLCVDIAPDATLRAGGTSLLGDLNGDGRVDIADALWALRLAVGLESVTGDHIVAGDLNGDGRIDSADAVMLQRMAAGFTHVNPTPATSTTSDPFLLGNILDPSLPVTVRVDDEQARVGEEIDVAVRVDNAQGMCGYDITLSFDAALLDMVNVREGTVVGPYPQEWRLDGGTLRISMGRREALYEPGKSVVAATLALVRFRVKALPTEGDTTLVRIEGAPALKGQYGDSFEWYTRLNRVHGELRLEAAADGEDGEGETEGEEVELKQVPNVVNLLRDVARDNLLSAGFKVGEIDHRHSNTVAVNRVIAQDPPAGDYAPLGSGVHLTVSLGAAPADEGEAEQEISTVRVPNVKGMSLEDATRIITNVGLEIGRVDYQYTTSTPEGHVVSQRPEASVRVDRGTQVDLVVATRSSPEGDGEEDEDESGDGIGCDCNRGDKAVLRRLFDEWLLLGVALMGIIAWRKARTG